MKDFKKLSMYDENIETTASNSTTPLLGLDNVMQWVAVDKELPVEVRRVLAIMSSGLVSVCYRWGGEWYMNDKADTVETWGYGVTHWMPLPQPPCA